MRDRVEWADDREPEAFDLRDANRRIAAILGPYPTPRRRPARRKPRPSRRRSGG